MENEQVLCENAAMGDREAFGRLYTYYYPQLFGSIAFMAKSEEDAEEILQDAFIKVWKTRERLVLVRSLGDYLFIVAKRLLFDRLKHEKLRQKVETELAGYFGGKASTAENSPEHVVLFKQYQEMAQKVIGQLPDFQRDIFLMRTRDEKSLDEIAAAMNISKATVKRNLSKAIEQFRDFFKDNADWLPLFIVLFFPLPDPVLFNFLLKM
jgi:RNA polymerase sigma-70 factor (family 1)